jgi:cation/acetate symporter
VVSGSPEALVTGADWSWFPLSNPGIISIPAGFLLGWLGTVTSKEPESEERYTELEVRSLTGAGSEVAVHH